ncbi:MAG: alpha-amylase, partial [Eubacteriales bacterium]|nr:alpha-amylase [Eubacteriales bacterium]
RFQAVEVNPENRLEEISEPHDIEGWTGFNFPGRGGKYSEFVWNFSHFSGVDYDQSTQQSGIFKILGENKDWSKETSSEKGNYDYLMNADIDHSHPDVVAELERYAFWLIEEMGYDGFRYDALKHISSTFIANLTAKIHEKYPDFEFFGEYWEGADEQLSVYLEQSDYRIQLFDVPLHFRFQAASNDPGYDLSQLFSGALVHEYPAQAVTFVDNHDSQPGQSLESWVAPEFKEIAYALILLRRDGYPCIFAGDFDGIQEADYPGIETELRRLMALRRDYAYGEEELLFTEADAFGLLRHGTEEHPGKLLLLYSRSEEREVEVDFSANWAGRCFVEAHLAGLPGGIPELMEEGVELNSEAGQAALAEAGALVRLDESGRGSFKVLPGTLAYWYSL